MNWIKVLAQEELPEGERRVVKVQDRSILLIRHRGEIYALASSCPHMGGNLKGGKIMEDGTIVCPLHHSAFYLRTGEVKEWAPWPPGIGSVLGAISQKKPLPIFPTRVAEGSIWVGLE